MRHLISSTRLLFSLLNKYRVFTILVFAFIFFTILFRAVSLDCQMWQYDYKLMWLNFLGHDYKLSYEVPKPLISLFAGIVNPSEFYLLVSLFCALWTVCILELAKELTSSYIHGIFAVLFCFFCNYYMLPFYFTSGYWPIFYIPFSFLAALLFLKKKYSYVFFSLFFSGLIRPESWVYFGLFIFLLWRDKEKIKLIYFIPAISPFIWMFFDYKISGNPFYSHQLLKDFAVIDGYSSSSFVKFLPIFILETNLFFRVVLIASGLLYIISKIVYFFKRQQWSRCDILMPMAVFPFLIYWIFSLKGNFNIYTRFFIFPVMVIYFYAALLPYLFFKKRKVFNLIFLFFLFFVSFKWDVFTRMIIRRDTLETRQQTAKELGDYLESYLKSHKLEGKIIVGGASSYFSYRFGPEFSHQILSHEAAFNLKPLEESFSISELMICQNELTPLGSLCDSLIRNPNKRIFGHYVLETIFTTFNKWGLIFKITNKNRAE